MPNMVNHKHDVSTIVELTIQDGSFDLNKLGKPGHVSFYNITYNIIFNQ